VHVESDKDGSWDLCLVMARIELTPQHDWPYHAISDRIECQSRSIEWCQPVTDALSCHLSRDKPNRATGPGAIHQYAASAELPSRPTPHGIRLPSNKYYGQVEDFKISTDDAVAYLT
jgi:hypothetical protein